MRIRLLLALLVLPLWATAQAPVIEQLREDFQSQGLAGPLSHQTLANIPASLLQHWLTQTPLQRFAITGFSQRGGRFAARVRVHFANGQLNYLRLEGATNSKGSYQLGDWYDYAAGVHLTALVALADWLESGHGKAFLQALQKQPEASGTLRRLSQGQPAARALWLIQCAGRPCQDAALAAQPVDHEPALWQMTRAIQGGALKPFKKVFVQLQQVLGADAYLPALAGQQALQYHQCHWLAPWLARQRLKFPGVRVLADATLQCSLAGKQPWSRQQPLLEALHRQFPNVDLAEQIRRFYRQQQLTPSTSLAQWLKEH
ncbi:MAG: hypothetical protein R3292_06575 [Alcanivorax sp.]|nr:hypothetical protein [Alcanivorax sp.]